LAPNELPLMVMLTSSRPRGQFTSRSGWPGTGEQDELAMAVITGAL
jgi:hypothetical protein